MNFLSLILGIAALVVFLVAAFSNPEPARVRWVPLGLALTVAMLLAQFLIVTENPITTG